LQSNKDFSVLLDRFLFTDEPIPWKRNAKLRSLLTSIVGEGKASAAKTFADMARLMEGLLRDSLTCKSAMQCKGKNILTSHICN